ncbi:hypothetical protein QZH41_006578 [Actinostola sp. cb2023]|nr:hypothetical protein QZH41_006578 [Actinostola sp. cb2023]
MAETKENESDNNLKNSSKSSLKGFEHQQANGSIAIKDKMTNQELTAKAEKLKGIKEELTDKNEELKNTSSVLEERDNTIQSLRTEITNMQENRETMQKELQDTREELSNSVSVHKDSGIYTEELQETIKELKSKAENREQDICDLKDQLEMAKKEVEGKGQEGNEKETQLREQLVNANSKAEDQEREIVELKDQLEMAKKEIEDKGKEFSEVEQFKEDLVNARSKAENQDQEIGELKDQLEMAKKEIESKGKDGTEVETQLREELMNAKSTIRSVNQGNSKLEAKLSNSQTIIETGEVERQKLKEEAKSLKDKIKWLERRRTSEKESTPKTSPRYEATAKEELERKLQQESQRRTLERIRELEQKVIQVNDEKLKLKQDYDEAVKALEAVDKVISRNVIDEKQKNMESLQESLQTEKKNCTKLEEDLEEMFYLKTKLVLIEDEKARIVEKLRGTEADLRETKEGLKNANQKNKVNSSAQMSLGEGVWEGCDGHRADHAHRGVGDNNGIMGGKEIFKCQPRHGKLIKMSDVQAVMHPRFVKYC